MRESAQAGLWFLESIDRVNRAIQGTQQLEQMMSDVLDVVLDVFACDRAWLLTPKAGERAAMMPTAERTRPAYPGGLATGKAFIAPEAMAAMNARMMTTDVPVALGEEEVAELGLRDAFGVRSVLAVTIYPKEMQPYLFGLHQCSSARVWTRDERDLLAEIGQRISVGLNALLLFRELRESERRLITAEELANIGYWEQDATTQMVTLSPQSCRILGRTLEERMMTAQQFRDIVHPDERGRVARVSRDELLAGRVLDIEGRVLRADGEIRVIQARAQLLRGPDGRAQRVFGTAQDVTERRLAEAAHHENLRASEERFRRMIEHASDLITVIDRHGVFQFQSPASKRMLGYEPEDMLGKVCLDYVHPADVEKKKQAIERALAQPGVPVTVEQRVRRADGKWRLFESILQSLPDVQSEGFIVLNSRDLTDARQLEEQLRQAQKMEAIGQLAGGVAHDFNNILAAIMMQTELANVPDLPEEVRDNITEIQLAAERAAELTRQLLMFSRRQLMQPRDVDLNDLVRMLGKMLQRLIGEGISLQLSLDPAPLITRVDPGMIDQLLMNLAINARDAMPVGGTLSIETHRRADAIGIRVKDTGVGIAAEVLPHIFEPFFTTKEAGKGTGLGLATVFGIVQQHRGTIDVTSQPGLGTTFEVSLPLRGTGEVSATAQRATPRGGNELVLVVEDDPALRRTTRRTLERAGYRVVEASHGREAIERWEGLADKPALVVTDLVMPGMSGHQVAAALRVSTPALKVIYTSGYSAETAGKPVELRLGETFVQKPVAPAVLLEAVRRCLDS